MSNAGRKIRITMHNGTVYTGRVLEAHNLGYVGVDDWHVIFNHDKNQAGHIGPGSLKQSADNPKSVEFYDEKPTFAEWEQEALMGIPKEFHSALSHYAYERSHAYGEDEVLSTLRELCEALRPCFATYKGA